MASDEKKRWDPSQPAFIVDVLRVMVGMWIAICAIGAFRFHQGFGGLLAGGLLAIALYLAAIQAGRAVGQHQGSRALFWLLVQQIGIWVVMALLLAVVRVHAVAFVLGVSILPGAIILTLLWYLVQSRRMPS